ncbi:uncharacterized protein LOC126667814 [Mercurialis annua]|uniref:uncharacterized protein LOC126667814 n=1 Tax=Mercurialis annua TaxID=3986 RepID=UPI00215FB683|nr:uncharacterized protein LOC126667814 [Mercurialis annua]
MQSNKSSSSPSSKSRSRKKHKRLDAICERVYNQNHNRNGESESAAAASLELRRSSRARRAPVVLDVSPPPAKKRKKKANSVVNLSGGGVGRYSNSYRSSGGSLKSAGKNEDDDVEGSDKLGFLNDASSEGWTWRSRLRLRSRNRDMNRNVNVERGESSTHRKRKLLYDDDKEVDVVGSEEEEEEEEEGEVEEEEEEEEEEEGEAEEEEEFDDDDKLVVVKLKRLGKLKSLNGIGNEMSNDEVRVREKDEIELVEDKVEQGGMLDLGGEKDEENDVEVLQNKIDDSVPVLVDCENGEEVVDVDVEKEDKERLDGFEVEKNGDEYDNVEKVEQSDRELDEVESMMDVDKKADIVEVDETWMNEVHDPNKEVDDVQVDDTLMNEVKDLDKSGGDVEVGETRMNVVDGPNKEGDVEIDETLMKEADDPHKERRVGAKGSPKEVGKDAKTDKLKHDPLTLGRPRVKQGRWCGLCGCANDGKPPKRLMQDANDSDIGAYSGSSASEEPNYDLWDGFGDEPGWLGRLLGPINDRHGIAGIWVHQHCAVWSPEVYFAGLGCLKNVRAALCRGRVLKCTRCGRPGATIGCRVDRCPKTYHLPCARANGCIFDHRKFLIACTDHRHLFQPYGNQYLMRIKKLKARKLRHEVRKRSNDTLRKDIEAEEKWLENCGEDEEFLKRESKRLHRDLLRIAPVYIGGSDSENVKLFEGWESVAGLKDVIQCMKEVVILPLLYPEFFSNLGITPPRGILLHGYPGTGKTLVVRALIGSCARGDKRIAYFARKGADCLGKYVGDSERQLRLLFQVAEKCQPSIIFFDEIDGLAPCRSRRQDQTHSSVVSTLLALMDGLKSRGSVVVIGATNRPEAVDPALRRPGRFDREIYFPLPSVEDRAAILSLHTRRWPKPVTGSLLQWVASRTVGFAGADLQALCTQAVIIALKRNFPLHDMLSAAGGKAPGARRVPLPSITVEERDWLEALACAPPPCSRREAGIAAHDLVASPLPFHLIPCLLYPLSKLLVSLCLDERLWLPPPLSKAAVMVKSVIISNLEKKNLPNNQWWFHADNLLEEAEVAEEIQKRLSGLLIEEDSYACSYGSADEKNDYGMKFEPSVHDRGMNTSLSRSISLASKKKSGYRLLVAGDARSGQRHVASCVLQCFLGNVEVQKVDLATISQEGHGDIVQGITGLLMKFGSLQSLVIFMPRIDLWAMEASHQVTEERNTSSIDQPSEATECSSTPIQDIGKENVSEKKESCSTSIDGIEKNDESFEDQCDESEMQLPQSAILTASHAWCSFVEQVEYISVSTSLIILATSELPFLELPQEIKQFFASPISNSSKLTTVEYAIPRFLVHIRKDFNRDMVISLAAAKLLRDIIQLRVLLLHQKAHIRTSSVDYKFWDSNQACCDTGCHNKNNGSEEVSHDHSKVAPPPSNRSLKGKSNLLLAISTFGNQILRFPHFAELCWVTSKLKKGPCVDVSGPWKGWPFNSCIIRPGTLDTIPATCSAGNIKSKDRYGLVRGLVAVGLSAYRGVYKSLREVSFEVRQVLELLVEQVNEKIRAGKDRHQYIRLLSQVAYLEDMVNSWAHALQSLEVDKLIKVTNAIHISPEFQSNHASLDDLIQNEQCKGIASNKSANGSECLQSCSVKFVPQHVELNEVENIIDHSSCDDRNVLSEEFSAQQIVHCDHTNSDKNIQNSTCDNQLIDSNADEQNGTTLGQCELENPNTVSVGAGLDNGFLKHSNEFAAVTEVIHYENGFSGSTKQCTNKSSGLMESCEQIEGVAAMDKEAKCMDNQPNCDELLGDAHCSSVKDTSHCADSGVVCSYICCSGCLSILQRIIQKILVHKWELNNSYWTADDVHDVVSSLSMDLLSAVRKVDVGGNSYNENLRYGNPELFSEFTELQSCHCQSSDSATECSCHSLERCATTKASGSLDMQSGMELEYNFRDGILIPVDSNKNVSFHCKYETFCLCSTIKSVVMMMQPSD